MRLVESIAHLSDEDRARISNIRVTDGAPTATIDRMGMAPMLDPLQPGTVAPAGVTVTAWERSPRIAIPLDTWEGLIWEQLAELAASGILGGCDIVELAPADGSPVRWRLAAWADDDGRSIRLTRIDSYLASVADAGDRLQAWQATQ